MDKILEMMKDWPPLGQGFFCLIVLCAFVAIVDRVCYYIATLFQGWEPVTYEENEEEY